MSPEEVHWLAQELQVYQIKLEMRNEELRRSQVELAESRDRFNYLYDFAPVGYVTLDSTGTLLEANLTLATMLGVERGKLVGSTYTSLVAQDSKDALHLHQRTVLDSDVKQACVLDLRRADGTIFTAQLETISLRDPVSGARHSLSAICDITERQRAEQVTAISKQRAERQRDALRRMALDEVMNSGDAPTVLRNLVEEVSATLGVERVSIWMLSEDGAQLNCLLLLEAAAKKYSSGLVIATANCPRYLKALRDDMMIAAEDAETDPRTSELATTYLLPLGITSMLDAMFQRGGRNVGVVCLEHTGAKHHWHSDEEVFATSVASLVAKVFTRIELRWAEETLRRSRDELSFIMDNLSEGVVMATFDGHMTYWNAAALATFGFASLKNTHQHRAELVDNFEFTTLNDQAVPLEQSPLARLFRRENVNGLELRVRRLDTNQKWIIKYGGGVVRDSSGKEMALLTLIDITQRRAAAEAARANEKLAATGRMAAGIAHEINNPLGALKNAFHLIRGAVKEDHPHFKYVALIDVQIQRVQHVIHQMIDLYRPAKQHSENVCLVKMIHGVLDLNVHDARAHGITFHRVLPARVQVRVPEGPTAQVLFNLLTNALEASPPAGTVTVTLVEDGEYVRVSVSDQGPGIPAAVRAQVFEPFFTTKTSGTGGGLGLGLSVSYSLVEALGGQLGFECPAEGGTTFWVRLPKAELNP